MNTTPPPNTHTARTEPPSDGGYYPNWAQCVTETPLNTNASNTSVIMTCSITKQRNDTVLRIAWDGNMAVEGCSDCCMRWYITVDGVECGDPGPIDAAIRQVHITLNTL